MSEEEDSPSPKAKPAPKQAAPKQEVVLSPLEAGLKSNDARVRLETLEQARFDNEADLKILQSALSSHFVSMRMALVYALSSTPAELALPILEKITLFPEEQMRLAAVEVIGSFGSASIAVLRRLVSSPDAVVSRRDSDFLASFPSESVFDCKFGGKTVLEMLRIVDKLDIIGDEESLRQLTTALINGHSTVRFRALRALKKNVDGPAREVFEKAFGDGRVLACLEAEGVMDRLRKTLEARGHITKTSEGAAVLETVTLRPELYRDLVAIQRRVQPPVQQQARQPARAAAQAK